MDGILSEAYRWISVTLTTKTIPWYAGDWAKHCAGTEVGNTTRSRRDAEKVTYKVKTYTPEVDAESEVSDMWNNS